MNTARLLAFLLASLLVSCKPAPPVIEIVFAPADGLAFTDAELESAASILRTRYAVLTRGARVVVKDGAIVTQLPPTPGIDPESLVRLGKRSGKLEFVRAVRQAEFMDRIIEFGEHPSGIRISQDGEPHLEADRRESLEVYVAAFAENDPRGAPVAPLSIGYQELTNGGKTRWRTHILDRKDALITPGIKDAVVSFDQYGRAEVAIEFSEEAANAFGDLTALLVGEGLAIVLDDTVQSVPRVMERIGDGSAVIMIGSAGSPESKAREADALANVLRSGAIPHPLQIRSIRQISPL